MKLYLILFSIVLLALVHVSVIAQPATITYQGKLLDSNNLPVNASNVNMSFAIYDASSGGTKLWPSSTAATKTVNVNVGLYSVTLGTGSGGDDVFTGSMFNGVTPYLEVTVEGSTLPRTAISNVPFALIANQLNGSGWASPGSIGSTTPSSATFTNVTIGVAPTSYTLPSSRGTNGQILQTDGSGNVSWVNNAGAGPAGGDLSGTYPNPSIAAGAVTSAKISDGTIVDADVSPTAAIAYSKLALTNSIQNSDLVANSVTTSKVANGTVTTSKMADSAISGLKLLTYAVTSRHIADGAVTLPKIDPTGASSGNVISYNGSSVVWGSASGSPTGAAGGDLSGTYPNPSIAAGAVTSSKIADSTITTADISPIAAIPYSKLALTNSIQNADIVANSVTTSKVANGTVTTSKLADSAVSGLKLLTYAVTNRHIADGAVTLPKISSSGATSGDVITYDGSNIVWGSAAGTVNRNATLTGNGSSGSPLGINLGNSNTWTANQTFAGTFLITSNARIAMTNSDNNARDLRLQEPSGTGSQYFGLRCPPVTNNGNYLWPAVVGKVGQVMTVSVSNYDSFRDSNSLVWDYSMKLNRAGITVSDSPYSVATGINVVGVDVSGGAVTVNLPAANSYPAGYIIVVKNEHGNAGSNNITIQRSGSDVINDSSTSVTINAGTGTGSYRFYTDGSGSWQQF